MLFGDKKNKPEAESIDSPKEVSKKTDPAESLEEASLKKDDPNKDRIVSIKESEYHKLAKDAAEYKDKYVRLFAEFDNVRKRMDKEKQEFVKYANAGLMGEFLHILDDLERTIVAAKAKHEDYSAFLKGIELVMAHINEMLRKNNVTPIVSVGKKFNPDQHEVLNISETNHVPEGTVVEEFQKGYFLGDRVVRTSKVSVAKPKSEEGSQSSSQEENKSTE